MTNHLSRVLLADDDREMRDLVAIALRLDGAEVVVARDGTELLAHLGSMCSETAPRFRHDEHPGSRPTSDRAGQPSFALIVADIRMPGCSGLQVLEGMRRAGWNTPMILMTALGDRATRARVEEQRAVLFDKPFDVDDLRTAALHLLRPPSSGRVPAALAVADVAAQSSFVPPDQPWRRR
jgi:DNA-binding response OmpR family regulator